MFFEFDQLLVMSEEINGTSFTGDAKDLAADTYILHLTKSSKINLSSERNKSPNFSAFQFQLQRS